MGERKIFHDSVIPLPQQTGLTVDGLMINAMTAAVPDQSLNVHFSLSIAADIQSQVEQAVARGEIVPDDTLQKLYTASPADKAALVNWLTANGFEITHTTRDGIYTTAKASQIATSLDVTMVPVTKKGITYLSAQNAPSLPVEVATPVRSINGLQPFRQMNKHLFQFVSPAGNRIHPGVAGGAAPNVANQPPYLVSEILKAYSADGTGVTGNGETIAILIDTFPSDADLQAFWTRNGLPVTIAQVQKINVSGGPLPAPSGEETLDASWTSGVAPGANIRIYASGALTYVALDRALDRIISDLTTQPGTRQLSISLGAGETFMSPAEMQTEHTKFLHLAGAGVNVFVSSGDAGSNPDHTGHSPTGPLQVEYEASDAAIIAVGGTSLHLDPAGAVSSETGWSASGGGASVRVARPAWQTGNGVPNGAFRLVPDVSAVADPQTGAFLVFNGNATAVGGTSWSAPIWAGICALINEARRNAGKPTLGFLNPLLYPLLGTPAFRDVTSGSNGAYHCGPGYDQVTGIGAPNVRELIQRLP